ncbi:hypothetical protein GCM10023144_30710 [Pigmentiphaga soli]|uniref:Flp family type IVb pilin n=1 Tax=Pigmentiphaga soli TaxID=1007095 RepID=A0ABP8HAH3_9BURK
MTPPVFHAYADDLRWDCRSRCCGPRRTACARRTNSGCSGCQRGQAMIEYLVLVAALVAGLAAVGLYGDDGGLAGRLVEALRGFHLRFAAALAWPV